MKKLNIFNHNEHYKMLKKREKRRPEEERKRFKDAEQDKLKMEKRTEEIANKNN